jgi:hypothetical protein
VLKQSSEDAMACELQALLNAPLSASVQQIADRLPHILVIPPVLSYGQLNRLGMDRILSEKMVTLLIPQYPNMLIKQAVPVYGQNYSMWRQDMDSGWLTLLGKTDAGVAQQIIMGEFGQTLHTLTVTIRWIQIDSGQVVFNQTFHGDGPDKINLLLSDWMQAMNKQALARLLPKK